MTKTTGELMEVVAHLRQKNRELQIRVDTNEAIRQRFRDVIPDLCVGSWEEIWERVRDQQAENKRLRDMAAGAQAYLGDRQ